MRTNPKATLESLPSKLGDKNPAKYVRGGYTPRQRDEHEAMPPSINVWKQPVYVPENTAPARRGADNFLSIKSKGV